MRGSALAKKRGRPPKDGGRLPSRIVVACSEEYEKWFDRLSQELRTTASGAFDRIVAEWAKEHGHEEPPPRT